MNIIVCVKQVPGTTQVDIDPVTGTLKRDGVASKLNPYDLFAIETALSLREQAGGTVRALTMGPPQAKAALEETVSMGADGGVLLSDRKLGGADVLATSYALAQAVGREPWDLILCGKQTTDGDTAQVGAEMAEFLGVPHASNVLAVESVGADFAEVRVNLDTHILLQRMPLPCVLCMESDCCTPRLPSFRRKLALRGDEIRVLAVADLSDNDANHYGLAGSPTQVERTFAPEKGGERVLTHEPAPQAAAALAALLRERKFVQEA